MLLAGAAHFALVFAAGFALGTLRVLVLVPWLGERTAELCELPLMAAVALASARLVVRRARLPSRAAGAACGLFALALMLTAELTLVLALRGLTLSEYVESRDPVSGTAYLVALAVFALAPMLAGAGAPRA